MVAKGEIELDPAQEGLVARLGRLASELKTYRLHGRPGVLSRLFGVKPPAAPRGIYIYGEVGRGKTLLMDLFFAAVEFGPKRRR